MTWKETLTVAFTAALTLTVITVAFHEELLSVRNDGLFEVAPRDQHFDEDHSLLRVIQKKLPLIGRSVSPVPAQRLVEDLDDDVTGTSYTLPGFGLVKNCGRTWNVDKHLHPFREVWHKYLVSFAWLIIFITWILGKCYGTALTLLRERKLKKREGRRKYSPDDDPSCDDDDDDDDRENGLGNGTRNQTICDITDNPAREANTSGENETEDTETDIVAIKKHDQESLSSDTPCREQLCDHSPHVDEIPGLVLDEESRHIFPDDNDCTEKEGTEVNVISNRGQKTLERSATENGKDSTLWCNMAALDEWGELSGLDSERDEETAREAKVKDNDKQVSQIKHARDLKTRRRTKICNRMVNGGTVNNTIQGLTKVSAEYYHLEIDDEFKKELIGYRGGTIDYIAIKNDVRITFPTKKSGFVIIKGDTHSKVEAACQDIQRVTSRKTGGGRAQDRALVKGNETPPGLIKIGPRQFKTQFQTEELAILIGREGRNIRAMSKWYGISFRRRPIQAQLQECLIKGTDEDVLAFYSDALLFIKRKTKEKPSEN